MMGRIIVVAAGDDELRTRLEHDLDAIGDGAFSVESHSTGRGMIEAVQQGLATGGRVPIVFVHRTLADGSGVDALIELNAPETTRAVRKVLVESDVTAEELDVVIRSRSLDSILPVPWDPARLRSQVQRLLTEYFVAEAPSEVGSFGELADIEVLSSALAAAETRRRRAEGEVRARQRSFLDDRDLSDDEVERAMMDALEEVLGSQPRQRVEAGTVLLESGKPVDVIRVVTEGRVRLTLRVDNEETTFHSRTTGRIIGLLSMPHGTKSFFTVVAETDVTFIPLTVEQIDAALRESPTFAVHFVSVLLRSMARRNRRSAELQIRVRQLAGDLEAERDRLRAALDELARTQGRLIESEKLALLGQLAAGIGHELNNPVAAISRAAEYLQADVEAMAFVTPEADRIIGLMRDARTRAPLATRDERAARRNLAEVLGDEALATRFVRIGVTEPEVARRLLGSEAGREQRLEQLEHGARVGVALRTIASSAERIAALVRSVKAYARPGEKWVADLDVNEGIDECLLLLGHELHEFVVEREFGDLPPIPGSPGELNQVWTNLITNAIQAMGTTGTLTIRTSVVGSEVQVEVIDTGHGISEEDLGRVFEPSFTTREGRVEFGLGLGLQIARDVVHRHEGTIAVDSEPGRTRFTVRLPLGPAGREDGR